MVGAEDPSWWGQGGTNFVVLCSAMLAVFGVGYRALKPLAEHWIETNRALRMLEIEQYKAFAAQVVELLRQHAKEHSEILTELRALHRNRQDA